MECKFLALLIICGVELVDKVATFGKGVSWSSIWWLHRPIRHQRKTEIFHGGDDGDYNGDEMWDRYCTLNGEIWKGYF